MEYDAWRHSELIFIACDDHRKRFTFLFSFLCRHPILRVKGIGTCGFRIIISQINLSFVSWHVTCSEIPSIIPAKRHKNRIFKNASKQAKRADFRKNYDFWRENSNIILALIYSQFWRENWNDLDFLFSTVVIFDYFGVKIVSFI